MTCYKSPPKYLAAFDFDYTIVNDNTDTIVAGLVDSTIGIPAELKSLAKTEGWTRYMQEVFRLLYEAGTKPARIKKTVVEINETPGMVRCLKTLCLENFDVIIISDSNSEFIRDWLDAHDLHDDVHKVFTNPAHFDRNGLLILKPYDHQTECKMSSVNMCKGKILTEFMEHRKRIDKIEYDRVFFIGDGANDICAALRLSQHDYACMRSNYTMDKRIKEFAALHGKVLRANTIRWNGGDDLLNEILGKTTK